MPWGPFLSINNTLGPPLSLPEFTHMFVTTVNTLQKRIQTSICFFFEQILAPEGRNMSPNIEPKRSRNTSMLLLVPVRCILKPSNEESTLIGLRDVPSSI